MNIENEIPESDRCCGNCDAYKNEDFNGVGWCDVHKEPFYCDECCELWGNAKDFPVSFKEIFLKKQTP